MSLKSVRESLSIGSYRDDYAINLDGVRIGNMVTFGNWHEHGHALKTTYASRINGSGNTIEEEATSPSALLNKVAFCVNQAVKAGTWHQPEAVAVVDTSDLNSDIEETGQALAVPGMR